MKTSENLKGRISALFQVRMNFNHFLTIAAVCAAVLLAPIEQIAAWNGIQIDEASLREALRFLRS